MQNPLGAFCNTFDLHKAIIGLENKFRVLFEWPLKTCFTVQIQSNPTKRKSDIVRKPPQSKYKCKLTPKQMAT